MIVCIAGIGLIGGSMAIDLRRSGFATKIVGVDPNSEHIKTALEKGIIDSEDTLDKALGVCDLIVLSCPVDAIAGMLTHVLDRVKGSTKVVTDTGSCKHYLGKLTKEHPARERYVSAHPMAGTEYSGPQAAMADLFRNKVSIICDKQACAPDALALTEKLYANLGSRLLYMDSLCHDQSAASVSHLSHLSSFALSLAVLQKEKDQEKILAMAGGGFVSTVRLAKSESSMWVPVFLQNADPNLEMLDTYIDQLLSFRKHISEGNARELQNMINKANKIKSIIP